MGYRPDDWKNPFKEEVDKIIERGSEKGIGSPWLGESMVGLEAFEDGAEAMLDALKKGGTLLPIGTTIPISFTLEKKGYLAFIPEDE